MNGDCGIRCYGELGLFCLVVGLGFFIFGIVRGVMK